MTSTKKQLSPEAEAKKLREFGLIMALACVIFAGIAMLRGKLGVSLSFSLASAPFLILGLLVPTALRLPEKWWMIFAEKLSVIMTFVIVTLTFFLVITPMGILCRVLGKDFLGLKYDKGKASYWEPVEPDGPGSRHYLPY